MNKKTLSTVFIILATVGWGAISLASRPLGTIGFSSMQITVIRLIMSTILLGLYLLIKDKKLFVIRKRDLLLFIVAGINFFFLIYLYISSISINNSASVAGMLLYTSPIWIMICSRIILKEKITLVKIITLLGTVGGCALLLLTQGISVTIEGLFVGLGSGLSYGLYSIYGKILTKDNRAETNTFYTFLFSSIVALFLIRPSEIASAFSSNVGDSLIYFALLVVAMTILPYIFYTFALDNISAGTAGMISILDPVIASVTGVLIYGDSITAWGIVGIVIVIASLVALEIFDNGKKTKKKSESE